MMRESFKTGQMANGALFLVLQSKACWEDFADLSQTWAARIGAEVIAEPAIGVDECLLAVKLGGEGLFWITYDDFQAGIHLEPQGVGYHEIVLVLQARLLSGG